MPHELKTPSIRILSTQLADQIAAGEVIERPASVLKELIENALDAGARRIDVDLQTGGMDAIRVTDDGHGIVPDELRLAISRHATSKITELDDLLHLGSLGFRGEALASICSVSQWELTSRTVDQEAAHQIRYDSSDQPVAANHRHGTTVWIRNLFYNTPARRKFLRAERTEFRHSDDVIRRMALARFDVGFYVKHNGRQVHRLPAVSDDIGQTRRVAQLCGEAFIKHALLIDFPRQDMRLWGWISQPDFSRQQTDLQYFYINGRIIRDRVINHAIRLAYQELLPPGRHAAYVLHLELDPAVVDVNVHPTKHEVRFREARMVHDFITRTLRDSLQQQARIPLGLPSSMPASPQDMATAYYYSDSEKHQVSEYDIDYRPRVSHPEVGDLLAVLYNRYALVKKGDALLLIDIVKALELITCLRWQEDFSSDAVRIQPLLIPERIPLTASQQSAYETNADALQQIGFDMTQQGLAEIMLRGVPAVLREYDARQIIVRLLDLSAEHINFDILKPVLLQQQPDISKINFETLFANMHAYQEQLSSCQRVMSEDALQQLFNSL